MLLERRKHVLENKLSGHVPFMDLNNDLTGGLL
jgi:hypothetical protein